MVESLADPPVFPFESAHGLDAATVLARLRAKDPVPVVRLASGGRAYLTTRYDDVRRVHNGLVDKRPALIARCSTARPPRVGAASRRRRFRIAAGSSRTAG